MIIYENDELANLYSTLFIITRNFIDAAFNWDCKFASHLAYDETTYRSYTQLDTCEVYTGDRLI